MMGFQLKKLIICFSINTAELSPTEELLTEKGEHSQCLWTAVKVFVTVFVIAGIEVGW